MIKIIENPTFHGGLIVNEDNVFSAAQHYKDRFEVKTFKETLYKIDYGLLLLRHNFLFVQTNQVVTRLSEGGIIQRWVQKALNQTIRNVEFGPEKLTMDHLMIGFQIWLVFLSLALTLFFAEQFRPNFEKFLKDRKLRK